MFRFLKHHFLEHAIASLLFFSIVGCGGGTNDHPADSKEDDTDQVSDESDATSSEKKSPPRHLVRGLDIVAVDIFQSTRIPLLEDGQRVPEDIPLIQDKEALLRVSVARQEQWTAREILVEATVSLNGGPATVLREQFFVERDFEPNDLESSLNVILPRQLVTRNMSLSVSLFEADNQAHDGQDGAARWPPDAPTPLYVEQPGGDLRILIVPIQYNEDGSGRLPDLGEDQLALYKDLFMALYPISNIVFEFADVMIWNEPVNPTDESAWSTLHQAVIAWRNDAGVDSKYYVYGLFAPTETYGEYCSNQCFRGLSHTPFAPETESMRVGVGLGFEGESSAWTMVHGIGHNHGRLHAPAGSPPSDTIDDEYPVAEGLLDDWGYDRRSQLLFNPSDTYDFMSYASDIWVSGYNYKALHDWSKELNTLQPKIIGATARQWASMALLSDGTAQVGPTLNLVLEPSSEQVLTIELLNTHGEVVNTQAGMHYPNSHGGGLVVFANPPESIAAVRVAGFEAVPI